MKIFIDSTDVNEIKEAATLGLADGVTTNPTLIARSGVDLEKTIRDIASFVEGPVNAEVTSLKADEIVAEGRRFAKWGKNVHVKIPINHDGLVACHTLSKEGIPCTMTLVFSPGQAILAARAGAAWICPFVGRLDDISHDGMELILSIVAIY
jgi:transaldolase